MADYDDEYVPCVCCGMGNQMDNGFCYRCNEAGCEQDMKEYYSDGH